MKIGNSIVLVVLAALACSLPPPVVGTNLRAAELNTKDELLEEEEHDGSAQRVLEASYHSPRREGEPCKDSGKKRCHNGLTCVDGTCKAGVKLEEEVDLSLEEEFDLAPASLEEKVDLKFQTHDACAANYTCPLDSECLVKADGQPGCFCPGSGRTMVIGVSCAVLDGFNPIPLHSSDDTETCDPQEAGCGFGASCFRQKTAGDNYKDEVHCMCPGNPESVPKGLVCVQERIDEHLIESADSEEEEIPVSGDSEEGNLEEDSEERHLETFTSAKSSYLQNCVNTPNWKDSANDGCDWYEKHDKHGCPSYGTWGSTSVKANDACCHCKGARGLPSDAFTIFFLSDLEIAYRGHSWMEAENIVKWIVNYGKQGHAYTHYPTAKMKPSLYIHGGDASEIQWKWGGLVDANWLFTYVFNTIYNSGVPFISILGNHDMYESYKGPHPEAKKFMQQSFAKSKSYGLTYQEFKDSSWYNSIYYAKFKGLQIGTVNNRMENTGTQFNALKSKFDKNKPALFFSHKPLHKTGSEAHKFSDWKNFIAEFPNPTHFSGDIHVSRKYYEYGSNGKRITDFTAPYLFPWNSEKQGFLSILVSPTKGVLEVKKVSFDFEPVSKCWKDGIACLGADCDKCCANHNEYWESKAHIACGHEPCWTAGSLCGAGSTCTSCCNNGDYSYWYGKAFTACGKEPCWRGDVRCGAGTSCNRCCNSYRWVWSWFGHFCY